MAEREEGKSNVWQVVYRLVLPYRKRFLLVVFISVLGTGASLLEPLIYREAVNDVAGLFVHKAKQQVGKAQVVTQEDYDDPVTGFFQRHINALERDVDKESGAVVDSFRSKTHKVIIRRVKEPHTQTHVASRTPAQALTTLLWAVVLLFLINLFGKILWYVGENMNVRLACRIEQGFIERTFSHVLQLPLQFFSKRAGGAISKQIDQSEEVSAIVNGFSQQILPELLSLAGILAIMFWQNVPLTLIAVAVIPIYTIIAIRSSNKLERGLDTYYSRWEDVSARISGALNGIKTVKLSGAEKREVEKYKHISSDAYKEYVKRNVLANKYVFWEGMLTHLSNALVLGYGGYLALLGRLTPGDVVMFVAYLDRLYGPIDSLASLWVDIQQNVASLARAFKLLDVTKEEKVGRETNIKKGNIEFKDVHFGYVPEREVLKGISCTMEAGKLTAIVGSSGAGKTTTVDLLLKLFEPKSGEILIDGINIKDVDAASIRKQTGMVIADGAVFHGTLADNIRYKRSNASEEAVLNAAIAAGMKGTLERLPDGLQTIMGESGFGLSVGEKQRIQIARVLVAKPKILVLDEATANLDYATEAEIRNTVEELRRENTVIVIAHRYAMVRNADKVIVLSAGEIIEQGTPGELIAKNGWFAGLARAAEGEEETSDAEVEEEIEEAGDEDEAV